MAHVDFDKLIDQHLYREFRPKRQGVYYPSEIGSCLRKTWYSYKRPLKATPELTKIFQLGNILHDFIVQVLNSEKVKDVQLLSYEFPLKQQIGDLTVSGRVDDLILVKASGKKVLVEVKSTGGVDKIDGPKLPHVLQLQFYMHAAGVHDGILLYVDKSTLKTRSFPVDYSEVQAEATSERFKKLHELLKKGELPEPEAKQVSSMNWMCSFCEYKPHCDKDEK
ncbi:PD-(D/E)XK nuclease family protein [Candidatus Micrarchaeota archaeon]|nr:PD-(D/E)XK nuclease family protein [Candidatus Micrarchaeota archaeon]